MKLAARHFSLIRELFFLLVSIFLSLSLVIPDLARANAESPPESHSGKKNQGEKCASYLTGRNLVNEGSPFLATPAQKLKSTILSETGRPFFSKKLQRYSNLSLLRADLASGELRSPDLPGEFIEIPVELGLPSELKVGRFAHLRKKNSRTRGFVFFIGGLFNSIEVLLSPERRAFMDELLRTGNELILPEMVQGLTAALEINERGGAQGLLIDDTDQMALLAFYILKSIEGLKVPLGAPISLVGHSYGGWLLSAFASHPQYNGKEKPQNPVIRDLLKKLKKEGLIAEDSFKGIYQRISLVDPGLGSLIYPHPEAARSSEGAGFHHHPFAQSLGAEFAKKMMQIALLSSQPSLSNDEDGLRNSGRLYAGIHNRNVFDSPLEIPLRISITLLPSGKSELIPEAWPKAFSEAMEESLGGTKTLSRSTITLLGAEHDPLPSQPLLGRLLGQLNLGKVHLSSVYNQVNLRGKASEIRIKELSSYSGQRD